MVYGFMTHSFLNSAEHRQMKKTRAEATKTFEAAKRPEVIVGPICTCRSFRYPHEISAHKKLRGDNDWRTWQERQAGPEYFQEPIR